MNSITASSTSSGIGMEFVRPMGVPPYMPSVPPQVSQPTNYTPIAPPASNIHGGKVDLKA